MKARAAERPMPAVPPITSIDLPASAGADMKFARLSAA
jgi:hypothetical protein